MVVEGVGGDFQKKSLLRQTLWCFYCIHSTGNALFMSNKVSVISPNSDANKLFKFNKFKLQVVRNETDEEEIESVEFLVKQKNGKKSMYIEGVFLQGNIENRNGECIMETLRREVGRYNENHIQSGRALGELGHPES